MFMDLPLTELMHIHSLSGELREATILKKIGDNLYLAQYGDVKCTAIFNIFVGKFYVDDKYGVVHDSRIVLKDKEKIL